jgi:hypothetical protein
MRERMNAKINSRRENNEIKVTLEHSLDKNLYDLPLTLKTYVDGDAERFSVQQGEKKIPVIAGNDKNGTYLQYQAMPNSHDVIVSKIE